jgi:hypothetical protein
VNETANQSLACKPAVLRVLLFVALAVGLALMNSNCGGAGGSSTTVPSSAQVQFTSPVAGPSIDQGQSISLAVSVYPPGQGVTWSLQTAFGEPVGALANESATGATYIAPSSVAQAVQVNVVATSVANPTVSAFLPVSIDPPPQITSNSPTPAAIGCPPAGTVIPGLGSSFGTVWIEGVSTLTYYLNASGGVSPYSWSVTSGSLPTGLSLGTPTSNQTVISGIPTTPGCSSVTLQLTDAAGVSVTTPYYLIVLPPGLDVQLPPLAIPQVGIPYPPTSFAASNGVAPYSWSLNANTPLPPGLSFSAVANNPDAAAISGTPTSAGLGQNFSPSLLVYDSQLPYPAVAQLNPSITAVVSPDPSCHSGSEANLTTQGPYAFLLQGFDATGPVVIAGNFTVDGAGNVTGGSEDINGSAGPQTNLNILASGSSYTLGSDNRGCLTLANSAGASVTFRFATGGCSTSANLSGGCLDNGYFTRGRILEDDSASQTRASGIFRLANPSAFSNSGLSGLYSFGLHGWDSARGRYAMAGSANASSGNFTSVAADMNDAGAVASNLTDGSGTYNISSTGRGTGTVSVGSSTFDVVVYVVSSNEAILTTIDPLNAAHPLLSGEAVSAPGPFTGPALENTYIFFMSGMSGGSPDVNIGLLSFDGVEFATGTDYESVGGIPSTGSISSNYQVDASTGRLSFIAQSDPHPLVGYVASAGSGVSGFLISTDTSAQAGVLEYQNANPAVTKFSDSALTGPYVLGTDENLDASTWDYVGKVTPNGNGGEAGCLCDLSGPGSYSFLPNQQFVASYSVGKSGVGFFGGQTISVTNGVTTYYIDESPLDFHPAVVVVEQ